MAPPPSTTAESDLVVRVGDRPAIATHDFADDYLPPTAIGLRASTANLPGKLTGYDLLIERDSLITAFNNDDPDVTILRSVDALKKFLNKMHPAPPGTSVWLPSRALYIFDPDATTPEISLYHPTSRQWQGSTVIDSREAVLHNDIPAEISSRVATSWGTHYNSSPPPIIVFDHPVIVAHNPTQIRRIVAKYGTCPLAKSVPIPKELHTLASLKSPGGFTQVSLRARSASRTPTKRKVSPDAARDRRIRAGHFDTTPFEDAANAISRIISESQAARRHLATLTDVGIEKNIAKTTYSPYCKSLYLGREYRASATIADHVAATNENIDRLSRWFALVFESNFPGCNRLYANLFRECAGSIAPHLGGFYPLLVLYRQRRLYYNKIVAIGPKTRLPWDLPAPRKMPTIMRRLYNVVRRCGLTALPLPEHGSPAHRLASHLAAINNDSDLDTQFPQLAALVAPRDPSPPNGEPQ